MTVVYFALQGTLPAWIVWALVALACYAASFCVWKDQRREIEKLRLQIFDSVRLFEIQNKIASFLAIGKSLLSSSNRNLPPRFGQDCIKWESEVKFYLSVNLNELAATTFTNPEYTELDRDIKNGNRRRLAAETRTLQGIGIGIISFVILPAATIPKTA